MNEMDDDLATDSGVEQLPSGSPSIEFYVIPMGVGIAYGIFGNGYFLAWPVEVVLFSILWGIGTYLFRTWKYRAYVSNCDKTGQQPRPGLFMFLQASSTAIVMFALAGVVTGVRWLFFS